MSPLDVGTFWWSKAKRHERAVMRHCETTLQRVVDEFAEHAAEGFPDDWVPCAPTLEEYFLWEAFEIDWQAVRDRTKPKVSA